MYLTPKRLQKQIERSEKLMRILWRLYSPYENHLEKIVEASYYSIKVTKLLRSLEAEVKKDYREEMKHPLKKKSIPPGYHKKENKDG